MTTNTDITPAYAPAFLKYLDILGFRELVELSRHDSKMVPEIHRLLDRLRSQYSQMGRIEVDSNKKPLTVFTFRNFSDLMVRSTAIKSSAKMSNYVNWELLAMANTQCDVVCDGILLRGAICIGDMYMDKSVSFGPALVQAYLLESETAVFPRIVIDTEVMRRARYEATLSIWRDYVTRGEDGVYFVDYLFGSYMDRWSYPAEDAMSAEEALAQHKTVVETKLRDWASENNRKRQKAIWLAHYHNSTVERLRKRFGDSVGRDQFSGKEISDSLFEF